MAGEGGKKNPYGVTNDPFRGERNPYQSGPKVDMSNPLKKKQKENIEEEFNQPDPVGDFVRRIIGGNKERKKTGY